MIVNLIYMKARPEKRLELVQTIHSLITEIKQKPGCLDIWVYRDVEDENELVVIEKWVSKRDAIDHQRSETFTVLKGTGSLMLCKPELTRYIISRSEMVTL